MAYGSREKYQLQSRVHPAAPSSLRRLNNGNVSCLQPVPKGVELTVSYKAKNTLFVAGCQAVANTIIQHNLYAISIEMSDH